MRRLLTILFLLMIMLTADSCRALSPVSSQDRPNATSSQTVSQSVSEQTTSEQSEPTTSRITRQTVYSYSFSKGGADYAIGTLQDLEAHSSLIALVTAQSGSVEIRANQPDPANGIMPDSHVLTPVTINQIYQSIDRHQVGDTIRIEEYYGTWPSTENPDILVVYDNTFQLPMAVGEQYIVFLTEPLHDGDYSMIRGDMGKYVYNDKIRHVESITSFNALSNLDLGIADVDRQYIPREYYEVAFNVIAKYMQN